MTDVELDYCRADAIDLVKAVFEDAPSFVSYTVHGDDEKIVGRTRGGTTSFGETVVVWIPKEQPESPTTITVRAHRRVGLNITANPWKYRSEFLSGLRDRKGDAPETFRRDDGAEDGGQTEPAAVSEAQRSPDARPESPADMWLLAAKISGALLLGLLCLVVLILVLAGVVP